MVLFFEDEHMARTTVEELQILEWQRSVLVHPNLPGQYDQFQQDERDQDDQDWWIRACKRYADSVLRSIFDMDVVTITTSYCSICNDVFVFEGDDDTHECCPSAESSGSDEDD